MSHFDVAVIGGGAAGLMAAGSAAKHGAKTILLEKMEKPARKVRITGKGRCNITNARALSDFEAEIHNAQFMRAAFDAFSNWHIVELLQAQGVATTVERGQRVFPTSGRAADVANALERWARQQGACISTQWPVENLHPLPQGGFALYGRNGKTITAMAVVVATGGLSYPLTGSTGDGLHFAKQLGHSIIPPLPSLVGIEVSRPFYKANGLTLKNVCASLWVDQQLVAVQQGEVMLTDFGLEGAAILRLSRLAIEQHSQHRRVEIRLDLKPALSHEQLFNRLVRELETIPTLDMRGLLRKLMPAPMIPHVLALCRLSAGTQANSLSDEELSAVVDMLKAIPFSMAGHRPWAESIVTAGGVSIDEIEQHTMQSKLHRGLYFAGEVMDVDANTGGYNLQIAFSSGYLAGRSAAKQTEFLR